MPVMFTTPGAITLYARFRGESTPQLLGWCQTSPEVDEDPSYLSLISDRYSRSKPAAKVWDGETHAVTAHLVDYDQEVLKRCQHPFLHTGVAGVYGSDSRYIRGQIVTGIGDFELFFLNDFYNQNITNGPVRKGRWYYSVTVGATKSLTASGTRTTEALVRFDCDNILDGTTKAHKLMTENLAGITFPSP